MGRIISVDLHSHLLEKNVKPVKWWMAVLAKKLDVVAITEHFDLNPKLAFLKLKELQPKNVLLVPGIELTTSIGHTLCFGKDESLYDVAEFFEPGLPIERAIELAEGHGFVLSIAHPWGISFDSAAFLLNDSKKLEKIVEGNNIGVEVYNGLVAQAANFVYFTNWIRRPLNFFEKIEKNNVAKKIRLSVVGKKFEKNLEEKARDVLNRTINAYRLGEKAKFITVGSDAHFPNRIGNGVLKLKFKFDELTVENFLKALVDKRNVVWAGQNVTEFSPGKFVPLKISVKKMELLHGLRYAAAKAVKKGVREKIVKKLPGKKLLKNIKSLSGKRLFGKLKTLRKKIRFKRKAVE